MCDRAPLSEQEQPQASCSCAASQQGAAAPPARRFTGRRRAAAAQAVSGEAGALIPSSTATVAPRFVRQQARLCCGRLNCDGRILGGQVPDKILHDEALNDAIAVLPSNYSFEVHKTVWRIRQQGAKRVALQFPEGLLMYACVIADILESFGGAEHVFILGDVTYGACCVDDFSAAALEADLLVHYGHSCLVPVDVTSVPCLYIFVDIKVDLQHLVASIRHNFEPSTALVLAGTIQFASSLQAAREQLAPSFPSLRVPQSRPLSPGEVLGCTAPVVAGGADAIVFVADGRFHLEAIMIANPAIPAYRYDPYGRVLTRERYDQAGMRQVRRAAVKAARGARHFGLVLGTLGRQGNPRILAHLQQLLSARSMPFTNVLLSEVAPWKLALMGGVDAWVQIACPRLSIDWGEGFEKPTLTPYEALVALGEVPPWWEGAAEGEEGMAPYPMDYYAKDGGVWNSSYHKAVRGGKQPEQQGPLVSPHPRGQQGVQQQAVANGA